MCNSVTINNQEMAIKEWKGQRVVTFADIDYVHGRPKGTAKRNFSENKKHFIEGEDYILATVENTKKYEIRSFKIPPRGLILLTETGYLMLVKSFTDDLAWTVQRALVKNYFRGKYETHSDVGIPDNLVTTQQKRKMYNGQPVLLRRDLEKMLGLNGNDINYLARTNNIGFTMISGKELDKFKSENPNAGLNMLSNIRLYNKDDVMKVIKVLNISCDDEIINQYFYEELSDYDKLWRIEIAKELERLTYRMGKDIVYRKMICVVASKMFMDCGLLDGIYDNLDITNATGHNLMVRVHEFRKGIKARLSI